MISNRLLAVIHTEYTVHTQYTIFKIRQKAANNKMSNVIVIQNADKNLCYILILKKIIVIDSIAQYTVDLQ